MKKSFICIFVSLFACVVLLSACTEKSPELLTWNDTPTSADTLYQNPVFEPDLADPSVVRAANG